MNHKLQITFSLVIIVLLSSCGPGYHLRQGNRLYNSMAYNMAIAEYEKSLSKRPSSAAQIGLAESYRMVNNAPKAEEAYSKVVTETGVKPIYKLRYATLLMRSAKYSQAKNWLDNYLKDMPNDSMAMDLRSSCDMVEDLKKDSAQYTLNLLKINTGQNNFSPAIYKGGIVFASDRSTVTRKSKMYPWTGLPFLDMYYSKKENNGEWGIPGALSGDVNGKYHDGPAAFAPGDTIMYFTRDNYVGKKVKEDNDEVVNLKIYSATKKDTSWKDLKELPFNSNNFSCGHPALSKDGNTMYFTSDMPGGKGGTDIWMVQKTDTGKWGNPVNMGSKVNTALNEMFPTLAYDTLLYFSSQGHINLGGLDIFSMSKRNNEWTDPVNMKYPINTNNDDFGLVYTDSITNGLLSSNRANGMQDNIYGFTKEDLRFTLNGIAVEKATQLPIEGVMVVLTNKTTGKMDTAYTGPDGKFKFKLEPNSDFSVVGSKDGFFTNTEQVSTVGKKKSEDMYVELKLELVRIVINKPIVVENIYYDLDKSFIRPDAMPALDNLVTLLKENPKISVELSSHTDSRADDNYNMKLSQRRADAAVAYIVEHGIPTERITAKGYGESQLVNKCDNKTKCTEEEHQQNRRTEFKVTGIAASTQPQQQ